MHSSLNYVKMPLNAVEIIIKASAFLFLCCLWPTEMIQETTEKSVIFISVTFVSLKVHSTYVLCDQFALVSGGVDKTSFANSICSKWKHVKRNFEIFQKILRLEIAINQRKGVKSIL